MAGEYLSCLAEGASESGGFDGGPTERISGGSCEAASAGGVTDRDTNAGGGASAIMIGGSGEGPRPARIDLTRVVLRNSAHARMTLSTLLSSSARRLAPTY